MTAQTLGGLSEEVKRRLKDILVGALVSLLRFVLERLMSNPGDGDGDADNGQQD